jgi:hypothetical protein
MRFDSKVCPRCKFAALCLPVRVFMRRTHNDGKPPKIWISFDQKATWVWFARGYKKCPWVISFKKAIEEKQMREIREEGW